MVDDIKVPTMLTLCEASSRTGISYYQLRNWCITGEIAFVRAGKKYLINLERLVDYLNGERILNDRQ